MSGEGARCILRHERRKDNMNTVATVMAEALRDRGVTHAFGLIGEGNMVLANALTDGGLEFVGSRHESAAVGMADGFARSTGKVGIATVTQGPGVTNTVTALITAKNAQSPVVLFAPEVPADVKWHIQLLDLKALADGIGIALLPLDRESPGTTVAAAHDLALATGSPVIVNFPYPALEAEVASGKATPLPDEPEPSTTAATPSPDDLAHVVTLLRDAERPVVIAGHGARLASAQQAIATLAEATGAAISTTLMGKGMLSSHPQSIGLCGGFSTPWTHQQIQQSDLVLVFGASLNQFTTHNGEILPEGRPIIHCDSEAAHIGRITPVDVALVGDAAATAAALADRFLEHAAPRQFVPRDGDRTQQSDRYDVSVEDGLLNAERLLDALNEILPKDRTVIVEGGHNMGFASRHLDVREDRTFFVPIEFGAIGSALGVGIGAAFARPDLTPVITIGDGSLLMSLGELETLCRYQVPCVLVVVDDGSYAAEYHALDLKGLDLAHSLYPRRDFAAVARAFGADARVVTSEVELAELSIPTEGLNRPLVIDCKVDVRVRGDWLG